MDEVEIIEKMRKDNETIMKFVEVKGLKEYLKEDQLRNLIKVLDVSPSKLNLIFSLLLDAGLRAEEIINIRKADIDMGKRAVKIRQHEQNGTIDWSPRSYACRRDVELSREVWNLIKPSVEMLKDDEFLVKKKGKYKLNSFINIINNTLKKTILIERACGTQVLRRTFIVKQIKSGMQLDRIASMMGYESIRVLLNFLSVCVISEGSNIIYKKMREA